jgi:predicted regulator of Ras-like GTPase activity (Roadblock/LC7/MglB family)
MGTASDKKGQTEMTQNNVGIQDIFQGAEKIEILGKLPTFLWAYIDASHRLVKDLRESPGSYDESLASLERILNLLHSAAEHLGNQDLKSELGKHAEMLGKLTLGQLNAGAFSEPFLSRMKMLEALAGQRRESPDALLDDTLLERELQKIEKIKTGRSADIIVSVALLDEIRDYLTKEVLAEGISTVLIIDNAGTLIVNIGSKVDLDVVGLAAVAAANFAATEQIAKLIGERDFVLLFYKGHSESFHFSRIGTEYIIVTIFDNELSLGLLRLKIAEVAQVLEKMLPQREA